MLKIQIPHPCHEDWNKMTLTDVGAYCKACCKEVIDFTKMSDDEVQQYFLNRVDRNTCGRFQHEQLDRIRISLPENMFVQKIADWKKYLAILLLAFGSMLFGCDVGVKVESEGKATLSNTNRVASEKFDRTFNSKDYVGGFVFTFDSVCMTKQEPYTTYGFTVTAPDDKVNMLSADTLQLKTDTSSKITIDTIPISITVPVDTLPKKSIVDSSGCDGIGFY